jgi:wyosine [tRNA(Phe)-imidazoG37] synthetase (radical SAM superfamily)
MEAGERGIRVYHRPSADLRERTLPPSTQKPAGYRLTVAEHDRDAAGLTYVYPVVSRRARGVSIGINLNLNDACNWRCIYCQVPGLTRGAPPPIDVPRLERELRGFVDNVLHGDFMERRVPPESRRLNDIAFSGNGEPTSAREFPDVVDAVGRVMREFDLVNRIKVVLITNGSLVHQTRVQAGLQKLAALGGEVWFKLDRATEAGIRAVNSTRTTMDKVLRNLRTAVRLCPTWVQTCVFALDGAPPPQREVDAYVGCLTRLKEEGVALQGVMLYGVARLSHQPEARRISNVSEAWLDELAERIRTLGVVVNVTP